ncbi:hypothetical protein FIBSPDRAFT_855025 [Athelia psychrophila]|uniref:Uncharacterized protein n=1 Tax=Athelia psychrophila TaxID=1759441 RepID=A0A166PS20_9AGAM|nr:hypothetical protein FIBSPDRAFT_855025 [Fibularhizoctonia sp. CBS 109695]
MRAGYYDLYNVLYRPYKKPANFVMICSPWCGVGAAGQHHHTAYMPHGEQHGTLCLIPPSITMNSQYEDENENGGESSTSAPTASTSTSNHRYACLLLHRLFLLMQSADHYNQP